MYFALQKHYPPREQYGDTLHFCRHCSILFWKVTISDGSVLGRQILCVYFRCHGRKKMGNYNEKMGFRTPNIGAGQ